MRGSPRIEGKGTRTRRSASHSEPPAPHSLVRLVVCVACAVLSCESECAIACRVRERIFPRSSPTLNGSVRSSSDPVEADDAVGFPGRAVTMMIDT